MWREKDALPYFPSIQVLNDLVSDGLSFKITLFFMFIDIKWLQLKKDNRGTTGQCPWLWLHYKGHCRDHKFVSIISSYISCYNSYFTIDGMVYVTVLLSHRTGPTLVSLISMTMSSPILLMHEGNFLTVFTFLTSVSNDSPSSYWCGFPRFKFLHFSFFSSIIS